MTLSAGLAALLAGPLLASCVAASGLLGVSSPGAFGARLSPRSFSVHNSYPATPPGGHYGGTAANNFIGSGFNNVGVGYNVGENYNNVGGGYNNVGGDYSNVGGGYSNVGGGYNNVGHHYNTVGDNYDGTHSAYIRNTGLVADSGYTVNTASSALRARSVHAVGPADDQGNYLGDYDDSARFQYRYQVSDPLTGDAKSQHETRDGGAVTGEYRVLEPNGLMRIVSYTADDARGFEAHVRWQPAEPPRGAAVSHQEVTQQQGH